MSKKIAILFLSVFSAILINAQDIKNNPGSNHGNRFEQLGTILPSPNDTEPRAVRRAPNTGNNVVIIISYANSMNPTVKSTERKP